MPSGYSLHFGLNHVNPQAYAGWDGALRGCINDANAMTALCQSLGYKTATYYDDKVTSENMLGLIDQMAHQLQSGDILTVSYSGHGGLIADPWGVYGVADTICLWDRQVISHELGMLWNSFRPGIRVLFVCDSCHSGTITRELLTSPSAPELPNLGTSRCEDTTRLVMQQPTPEMVPRAVPSNVQAQINEQHKFLYKTLFKGLNPMRASCGVLLMSGCQDNQTSCDGLRNGLFTERLLATWNEGQFSGNYRDFHSQIVRTMPPYQTPAYFWQGPPDPAFEMSRPFAF